MAGVHVVDRAVGVHLGVEEGDEGGELVEVLLHQPGGGLHRVLEVGELHRAAQRGADGRPHDRGGKSLAHDVADRDAEVVADVVPVVEVARDAARRLARRRDLETGRAGLAARQEALLGDRGAVELVVAVELVLHPVREVAQHALLLGSERVRFGVEHAEGADGLPSRRVQRLARVEAEVRVADHERVVREALVAGRVGDDEAGVLAGGDVAERLLARRLGGQPDVRLAPLPVAVEQRDTHHRDGEELLREPGDPVEPRLRPGVDDPEAGQRALPRALCLLHRLRVDDHGDNRTEVSTSVQGDVPPLRTVISK